MRSYSRMTPEHVDKTLTRCFQSKLQEGLAETVENNLRGFFLRQNIWVIPSEPEAKDPTMPSPDLTLQVIDGDHVESSESLPVIIKAKEICQGVPGTLEIKGADITLMPVGNGLNAILNNMLALRYGHGNYQVVVFDKVEDYPVRIEVEDLSIPESLLTVPYDVVRFALELADTLRPDEEFQPSEANDIKDVRAVFAPGFHPEQK